MGITFVLQNKMLTPRSPGRATLALNLASASPLKDSVNVQTPVAHINTCALNAMESTKPRNAEQSRPLQCNKNRCLNLQVSLVPTPVLVHQLNKYLEGYPNKDDVISGFTKGFRLDYQGIRYPQKSRNHFSARENPQGLASLLNEGLANARIAGPFQSPPFPNFRSSPLAVVPKKEPNKYRLIRFMICLFRKAAL